MRLAEVLYSPAVAVSTNISAKMRKILSAVQPRARKQRKRTDGSKYVKSNANKYNIDPKFFEKHDIHIHVPEGAVPKDGPSAGITLTTALVSVLTSTPAKANLAMTGEVTLRGNVLPIGGLREKSMAAHRSGISTVVIPKMNVKDLDELPHAVKESIQFIPVETVDQVLDQALVR